MILHSTWGLVWIPKGENKRIEEGKGGDAKVKKKPWILVGGIEIKKR